MESHNSIERVYVPRSEVAEKLKELASIYSIGRKRIVVEDKRDRRDFPAGQNFLLGEERTNLQLNGGIRFGSQFDLEAEDVALFDLRSFDFNFTDFSDKSCSLRYIRVYENMKELKENEEEKTNRTNEILKYLMSFTLQP